MEEDLRQAEEENIQRAIEEKNRREAEDYDKATNPPEVDPLAPKEWKDPMGNVWPSFEAYQKHWDEIEKGGARPAAAPWDYALGAVAAKPLVGASIGKWGLDKTLEVGMAAAFPDAPDTMLEQFMRNKQMGLGATAVKGARIAYDEILKNVFDLRIGNPFKLSSFVSNIGTSIDTGSSTDRWKKFGYWSRQPEPSQVTNPRFTAAQKTNVSNSLEAFYTKVEAFEKTGKKAKDYPLYWINPETNDIYRAIRKGRLDNNRLSLQSKNRYFRETLQSSPIQKKNLSVTKRSIARQNKLIEQNYLNRRNAYVAEINEIDKTIGSRGAGGKPGSAVEQEILSALAMRAQIVKNLEDLLEGKAKLYGEHGYNLANERVQNIVRGFPKFSLGDRKNFFPTLNKGGFKTFKDNLESVINSTDRQTGVYNYPEIVVNYNPNLHEGAEYIIRLENKRSIRLGGPQGIYPNQVYGDLIEGAPNGIDFFNDIPENVRRAGSREGGVTAIREWLESIGISPTPDPSQVESLKKYIPTDTKPKRGKKQTREEMLDFILPPRSNE